LNFVGKHGSFGISLIDIIFWLFTLVVFELGVNLIYVFGILVVGVNLFSGILDISLCSKEAFVD
jgi:hypothetical protein